MQFRAELNGRPQKNLTPLGQCAAPQLAISFKHIGRIQSIRRQYIGRMRSIRIAYGSRDPGGEGDNDVHITTPQRPGFRFPMPNFDNPPLKVQTHREREPGRTISAEMQAELRWPVDITTP